jgi:hypothetical protein
MRRFGVAWLALALAGCLGDLIPAHQRNDTTSPSPDLGGAGGGDLAQAGANDLAQAGASDLGVRCINIQTPLTDGHHNPGLDCMTCHNAANAAIPQFTVAGTLYTDPAGTAPLPGATVTVTDNAGAKYPIVVSTNGNFYSEQPVQFPVHVEASGCPNTAAMQTPPAVGNCNSCHVTGSRIHLP